MTGDYNGRVNTRPTTRNRTYWYREFITIFRFTELCSSASTDPRGLFVSKILNGSAPRDCVAAKVELQDDHGKCISHAARLARYRSVPAWFKHMVALRERLPNLHNECTSITRYYVIKCYQSLLRALVMYRGVFAMPHRGDFTRMFSCK